MIITIGSCIVKAIKMKLLRQEYNLVRIVTLDKPIKNVATYKKWLPWI